MMTKILVSDRWTHTQTHRGLYRSGAHLNHFKNPKLRENTLKSINFKYLSFSVEGGMKYPNESKIKLDIFYGSGGGDIDLFEIQIFLVWNAFLS